MPRLIIQISGLHVLTTRLLGKTACTRASTADVVAVRRGAPDRGAAGISLGEGMTPLITSYAHTERRCTRCPALGRTPPLRRPRRGTCYASHVHHPFFLHSTKTYVFELWEQLGGRLPATLVLPVGNGILVLGAPPRQPRTARTRPHRPAADDRRGTGRIVRATGHSYPQWTFGAGGRRTTAHHRGGHRDRPPGARRTDPRRSS
jgi:hypothetical protein